MAHVDIGEKIKKLRIHRKMTQAELAGDQITRNMLSRVENGAALPSLPTIWYLAERLEVPAGFLLAEGNDDRVWRKMSRIDGIRRVMKTGDARICLELCREDGDNADEEIDLIMAQCSLRLAIEAFEKGRLREVCATLDEAIQYAARTMYDTSSIRQTATLYFRFMHRLSPTLVSEVLHSTDDILIGSSDAFGRYVLACEALEYGEMRRVDAYLCTNELQEDGWLLHFRAHVEVSRGNYHQAQQALLQLLHSERSNGEVLLYCVFCDLEVCCRETGDFKGAYEYSQNKISLLEKMLQK